MAKWKDTNRGSDNISSQVLHTDLHRSTALAGSLDKISTKISEGRFIKNPFRCFLHLQFMEFMVCDCGVEVMEFMVWVCMCGVEVIYLFSVMCVCVYTPAWMDLYKEVVALRTL